MQEYAVQCKAMFWTFLPIFLLGQCAAGWVGRGSFGNTQILTNSMKRLKCSVVQAQVRCKHKCDEIQCKTVFWIFLLGQRIASGKVRIGNTQILTKCNQKTQMQ